MSSKILQSREFKNGSVNTDCKTLDRAFFEQSYSSPSIYFKSTHDLSLLNFSGLARGIICVVSATVSPMIDHALVRGLTKFTVILSSPSFNPFPAKGFPIDESNRLALDRVKSISVMRVPSAVKALKETYNDQGG